MARAAPCFARRETRLTCRRMVNGLLPEPDDHNCRTLAEAAGHGSPCRMQHLLSRARCDDRAMLGETADRTIEQLHGEPDGESGNAILIVDETSDVKSSADRAGAARQYRGATGGAALCQVAVTLTYAVPAGHALTGRALYLPADRAAGEERRELAGVPDEVVLATRPEPAGRLPRQAHDRGARAAFTVGDEVYGGLDLRRRIREPGTGYVMAACSNHAVILPSGRRLTVKTAGNLVRPSMWLRRNDVDLRARTVKVERSLTELPGGGYSFGPPKSDAGIRVVEIPELIVADLRWHLGCFAQDGDDGLVFTSPTGTPLRHGNFRRRDWLTALGKVGLTGVHFHDLRHTGNTFSADAGANLRQLMARMGHNTTRAAMIYLHSTTEGQRKIADAVTERARAELGKAKKASGTKVARRRKRAS